MARKRTKTRRKSRKVSAAPQRRRAPVKRRRTRAYSAAPKRRVAARRRRKSNPKGLFASPAVELGVAALAGVSLGAAADSAPRWSWLPDQLQAGHVIGAALVFGGWKLAKGKWRQRLIAAGIGSAGQAVARDTVAPAMAGILTPGSDAFPKQSNVRMIRGTQPRMSAQRAALAANAIPV
jgi:hypothetical protein